MTDLVASAGQFRWDSWNSWRPVLMNLHETWHDYWAVVVFVAAFANAFNNVNKTEYLGHSWTSVLVPVFIGSTVAIWFVDTWPLDEFLQPLALVLLPLSMVAAGACRFPDVVPQQDIGCVATFFVLVAAVNVHHSVAMWSNPAMYFEVHQIQICGDDQMCPFYEEAIRTVRRATMTLSAGSTAAHALTVALRRCDGFWDVTRASVGFGGALRLAAAAALRSLGADGPSFPPTNLHLGPSLLVSASYVLAALALTRRRRHALANAVKSAPARVRRFGAALYPARAAVPAPATAPGVYGLEGGCVVCCVGTNDHAFIACGHICACAECAYTILQTSGSCPICRCDVTDVLRTYLP